VVIPAHNEEANLPRTLRAVLTSAACTPVPVHVVVVLDNCDDGSERLAGKFGADVHFVTVDAGNVGAARAAGYSYASSLCAKDERTWYAATDADTRVDTDWLLRQLEPPADMVLGVVRIADSRRVPTAVLRRYLRGYKKGTEGEHTHIHGANMGFRADAYWAVGGFRALPTGEDVELVERFEAAGYEIRRDAALSVATSARSQGRAPGGFADHLRKLSRPAVKDSA
jgi:glycosyltransferase involved in cell wall biosynthesis